MKKNVFLALFIVFVCGCSRTMKCNLHIENNKFSVDKNYKVKYSGKSVVGVNVVEKYVVDDAFLDTFDNMFIYIKSEYENYSVPYTTSVNGNVYVLKSNFLSSNLSDDAVLNLLGEKNVSTYKSKLENFGFKCK